MLPVGYAKAEVLMLSLLCVALCFYYEAFHVESCLALCSRFCLFFSHFRSSSPRLGKRELVYVLLVHLFVYSARVNSPSLPLGDGAWLRLVILTFYRGQFLESQLKKVDEQDRHDLLQYKEKKSNMDKVPLVITFITQLSGTTKLFAVV